MTNAFFKFALRANLGKITEKPSLLFNQLVHLFVKVSGEAVSAGIATLSDASTLGETFLRLALHSHDLPRTEESDQVFIGAPKI